MNLSRLFGDIFAVCFPQATDNILIGIQYFKWLYFLADGICPRFKIFVKSLALPFTDGQSRFRNHQEAVRKAVKSVLG